MATADVEEWDTIEGTVDEKGKFTPDDPEAFKWAFLRHTCARVVLYVKRWRDKSSRKQLGYYWAVVVPMIAMEMEGHRDGQTCAQVHATLKAEHNSEILVGKDDRIVKRIKSTRALDTKQMNEYIDRCVRWAQDFFNLTIPPPRKALQGINGDGV